MRSTAARGADSRPRSATSWSISRTATESSPRTTTDSTTRRTFTAAREKCRNAAGRCSASGISPGGDVPPKSRFGNNATRIVFRLLCGIRISDTQTGLRALPRDYLPPLTALGGERFEYETNMLLEMKRLALPFEELPIRTIYNDRNKGTHFHPFRDSIKIYAVIFRFMLSSGLCSLIDLGLFTLINLLTAPLFGENESLRILTATAGARIVSSLVNFTLNRRRVFRSGKSVKRSALRYYILAAAQLLVSALCVRGLSALFGTGAGILQTIIKVVTDTVLFFVSFGIQRDWVYAD